MIPFGMLFGVLLIVSIVTNADDIEVCHQREGDYCKCVYDDGTGYDLTDLGQSKTALKTPGLDNNNLTFFYHPCNDVDIIHTLPDKVLTCKSATVCVYNHTDGNFTRMGISKDTKFSQSDGQTFLVIKNPLENGTTVTIQLGCSNLRVDRLVEDEPHFNDALTNDKQQYNLVLYSTSGCKRQLEEIKSMSTGSILVVTFFTCVLSYLVLGMTFNHFLVGARGIETIPNLSFWRDFPALVKDGVSFIQNGCKPVPTSELLTPHNPNPDSYVSI